MRLEETQETRRLNAVHVLQRVLLRKRGSDEAMLHRCQQCSRSWVSVPFPAVSRAWWRWGRWLRGCSCRTRRNALCGFGPFFMSPKSFPNKQLGRDPKVNDVPLSLAYTSLTYSVSAVLEGGLEKSFNLRGYVTAALTYGCARVEGRLPNFTSTQTQNRPLFDVGSPQTWVVRTRLYRVARAQSSAGVP